MISQWVPIRLEGNNDATVIKQFSTSDAYTKSGVAGW